VKDAGPAGHCPRVHRILAVSLLVVLVPAAGCGGATASQGAPDAGEDHTTAFDAWAGPDASQVPEAGSDAIGCGSSCDAAGDDASRDAALPACPATPPARGTACSAPDQVCEYGSSWWLTCNFVVQCRAASAGFAWYVQSDGTSCTWLDSGSACPPTWAAASAVDAAPTQCPFVSCVYPEGFCGCGIGCGGAGGAPRPPAPLDVPGIFVCIPTQPGCPEPRPLSGTPCDEAGAGCSYGFACGCGQDQQCMGGLWQAFQAPPCP
jgi:hypothetical protein